MATATFVKSVTSFQEPAVQMDDEPQYKPREARKPRIAQQRLFDGTEQPVKAPAGVSGSWRHGSRIVGCEHDLMEEQ